LTENLAVYKTGAIQGAAGKLTGQILDK